MTLPFEPELTEFLRNRFLEATKNIYDSVDIERLKQERFSKDRKHVFDFQDGVRFVVSKERVHGEIFLHINVSFPSGDEIRGKELVEMVMRRVYEIRGKNVPGNILAFEASGRAHFLFPEMPPELDKIVMPPYIGAN